MADPIEQLRAKVEAATKGPVSSGTSQGLVSLSAMTGQRVAYGCAYGRGQGHAKFVKQAEADMDLLALGWNLAKRLCTDEGVETVARAVCRAHAQTLRDPEAIECQVENAWDMWIEEARAAIRAILGEQP